MFILKPIQELTKWLSITYETFDNHVLTSKLSRFVRLDTATGKWRLDYRMRKLDSLCETIATGRKLDTVLQFTLSKSHPN